MGNALLYSGMKNIITKQQRRKAATNALRSINRIAKDIMRQPAHKQTLAEFAATEQPWERNEQQNQPRRAIK